MDPDPRELRDRLGAARLLLIFTPELCAGREPVALLEPLLELVDVIEVRAKGRPARAGTAIAEDPAAGARASYELARAVLGLVAGRVKAPLVLVDDRVDVALALRDEGCAGVHLGQADLPPSAARALLGEVPLIGLSTHDVLQVVRSVEQPVDYVGFGPIYPTTSKGYERGLGPEAAWVAASGCPLPLFPIGGINRARAPELENVGRAAVGSGILAAEDPAEAAREIREALGD